MSKRNLVRKAISGLLMVTGAGAAQDKDLLAIGSKAPEFALESQTGDTITLSSFLGRNYVVLIFYPGDMTPGCTKQLCAVRDDWSLFGKKEAVVFGINSASMESHEKFARKHQFPFPLLIDKKNVVAATYGSKGSLTARRTVYVVDKEGKIIYAKRGLPDNSEILASIAGESSHSTDVD